MKNEIQQQKYVRKYDTFWTVVFTDPITIRLTQIIAKYTSITPNQISLLSAFVGLMAAAMFLKENLILGAVLWQLAYILDSTDGKLARFLSKTSKWGEFVEAVLDGLRNIACFVAIAMVLAGRYSIIGVFVMVIYLELLLFYTGIVDFYFTLKRSMKRGQDKKKINFVKSKRPFGFYYKIKAIFAKYRIIPSPTSTECEALIFVIGPLTGRILEASILACILLLLYTIVYTFKTYYFVKPKV